VFTYKMGNKFSYQNECYNKYGLMPTTERRLKNYSKIQCNEE